MCLNDKRKAFINEYLKCYNASEAARRVGYKHPGQQGHRLLKNAEILMEIERRLDELTLEADQVLARLSEHATADISDFITEHGIVDWQAVNKKGYLIKKISHTKGKNSSIELHDSQSALTWLGKHHKLFTDRIIQEHQGKIELEHKVDLGKLSDEQLNNLESLVTSLA